MTGPIDKKGHFEYSIEYYFGRFGGGKWPNEISHEGKRPCGASILTVNTYLER